MRKILLLSILMGTPAFGLDELWIKVGYGAIVLIALFVLYKLIKTTEEEEKTVKIELPWNEMKSITKKTSRIRMKKESVDDAFDKAKLVNWGEGEKFYD